MFNVQTAEKFHEDWKGWTITVWQHAILADKWHYILGNTRQYYNGVIEASNRTEAASKVKEILQEKKG